MTGQIIELPEILRLREAIEALQKRLTDRVCERDELVYTVCKNIRTQYLLEFGAQEYKVYEAYCAYKRLRRKRDLIQARINRQEEVSLEEIERQLDEEFLDYKRRLQERLEEINRAIERARAPLLSEEEVAELKTLYRQIVKALHPDLHTNLTPEEKELFIRATLAYKDGDLATIRLIAELVRSGEEDALTLTLPSLEEEKERLETLVRQVEDEMRRIKEEPPYILRVYLEDPEKKRGRHDDLSRQLESYREVIRSEEERIKQLQEGWHE